MPTTCVVFGCNNRHRKGCFINFYHFPIDSERRRRWVAFVGRKNPDGTTWQPGKDDRLCSDHFISKKKSDIPTNPDYVPSVNAKIKRPKTQDSSDKSLERFERAQRRSYASEQARKALQLSKEANVERIRAVREVTIHFSHSHHKNTCRL